MTLAIILILAATPIAALGIIHRAALHAIDRMEAEGRFEGGEP